MTTLRQAAQQALEVCTDAVMGWQSLAPLSVRSAAMESLDALRDALAQEEQEQVTWMLEDTDKRYFIFRTHRPVAREGETLTPLYTHPPRREWQSLSEEEIKTAVEASADFWATSRGWITSVARAVERALKEKNA